MTSVVSILCWRGRGEDWSQGGEIREEIDRERRKRKREGERRGEERDRDRREREIEEEEREVRWCPILLGS